MPSYDAILIGGGTNGLACATRLAAAGRRVLVLEGADAPGGAALGLAHLLHVLDPRVAAGMDLDGHGLAYADACLSTTAVSRTGEHLVMEGAYGATVTGSLSAKDRTAWGPLRAQLLSFADVLEPFKTLAPPRLAKGAGNPNWQLARLGLQARLLGRDQFREFLRMLLINIHDVLNDELDDPRLKAVLAFDATLGSWLGPRSPNSLILLLNRLAGQVAGRKAALALPKGGIPAVAAAMAKSALAAGVTIRAATPVARILIENDRATGVELAPGETLIADTIISAISPRTTFLTLIGPRHLDAGFTRRIRDQKSRGAAAKLHLTLSAAPDFRGASLKSRLILAPSEHAVELAYNPVKYGEVPARPVMEIILPTAFDPAQEGHTLSAIVQYAPHDPKAGRDAARKEMLANTLAVLEDHAPGIGALITHAELLMPYDIEARFGMIGGNWHHGELSVEQMLFARPLPGIAQYETPIAGLWLAGAGCHPGGGISGAAGWNAAGRILKRGDA
jgi:phytoene dehydrogenase-like protein